MKTDYFDTLSGISGDMSLAALIDAGTPADWIEKQLNSLGIGPVELSTKEARKCGYRAVHINLNTQPETKHRHLHHIDAIIDNSTTLSERAKATAKAIFLKLGEAEAKVHGTTLQKVHFHEVGAADSICDIVGVAAALDFLAIERIAASPVPTGHGQITIAHGTVNIPAPATAELLTGIPIRHSGVEAELTTPTGAAILKTLSTSFGPVPSMCIEKIGYGAGTRDLPGQANILRVLIGHTNDATPDESIAIIETQVDDMTGEALAFALERIRDAQAVDVFTTPIAMKKNRLGQLITILAHPNEIEKFRDILWEHTTTLGVRVRVEPRFVLPREESIINTTWGDVRCKITSRQGGQKRCSAEYADIAKIAKENNLPLEVIERKVIELFEQKQRARP